MKPVGHGLGVLGLGQVSTEYVLRRIHQKYQSGKQEFSTCPLTLYQIDFQEINPFLPDGFGSIIPVLETHFVRMADLGIEHLLIPNISLHETVDQMNLPFRIFHAVDLAAQTLNQKKIKEVILIGTRQTMNRNYINEELHQHGITVVVPEVRCQNWLDAYRKKVYSGEEQPSDIQKYHEILQQFAKIAPVLIACTELSVHPPRAIDAYFDMVEIQTDEFLKFSP